MGTEGIKNSISFDFDVAKEICSKMKHCGKINKDNSDKLFFQDIYILDSIYTKHYMKEGKLSKKLIEYIDNSVYIMLTGRYSTENLSKLIDYKGSIKLEGEKVSFFIWSLINSSKKSINKIKMYWRTLKTLRLSNSKSRRFLSLIAIYDEIKDSSVDVENLILLEDEERDFNFYINYGLYLKKIKKNKLSLMKIYAIVEGYCKIVQMYAYEEKMLIDLVSYKKCIVSFLNEMDCEEIYSRMLSSKIVEYRKNNVSLKDVCSSKKFGFSCKIVQNTVFVKSKLDMWYIDVDKINNESVLFHGNDGAIDEYHKQKEFPHSNVYKIFKYIKDHDDYCLRKSRRKLVI